MVYSDERSKTHFSKSNLKELFLSHHICNVIILYNYGSILMNS